MPDIEEIRKLADGHSLIHGIDQLPKGYVRMETAFIYPDGSSVDVFVVDDAPLLRTLKLSDLGQTTSWLLDVQVRPWLSKKRQGLLEDALRSLDVRQEGGALERPLSSITQLIDGVVKLGQACVRVADLVYTKRSSLQTVVTEDIEELLADFELAFEPNGELIGRQGTKVRVDFLVHGARCDSALLALSSGNSNQAHTVANEIFRKWYDLDAPTRTEQRVTVFDDRYDIYRDEDLSRLRDLSDVVALSDKVALRDLLAA